MVRVAASFASSRGSCCVKTTTRGAALLALWSRSAAGVPTSTQAVRFPCRSRMEMGGSSVEDSPPFENAMPSS